MPNEGLNPVLGMKQLCHLTLDTASWKGANQTTHCLQAEEFPSLISAPHSCTPLTFYLPIAGSGNVRRSLCELIQPSSLAEN